MGDYDPASDSNADDDGALGHEPTGPTGGDDPSAIRSLAISPDDVVNAYIYTQENPGEAVLRATPPFHGRMRARLHVYRVDDTHLTGALHVAPAELLTNEIIDAYPRLEDTAKTVQQDGDAERVRERHADSHERWRENATAALVDTITIETPAGPHRVSITRLG